MLRTLNSLWNYTTVFRLMIRGEFRIKNSSFFKKNKKNSSNPFFMTELSSYFIDPPFTGKTDCQALDTFIPDTHSWKCPGCGNKVNARVPIDKNGNRVCRSRSCSTTFHWCPIHEKEVTESAHHPEEYYVEHFNCKDPSLTPEESAWRCPKCKGKPELEIRALDGGSLSCKDCGRHFHWCSLVKKEVEGSPIHSVVKERLKKVNKKSKIEDAPKERVKVKLNVELLKPLNLHGIQRELYHDTIHLEVDEDKVKELGDFISMKLPELIGEFVSKG